MAQVTLREIVGGYGVPSGATGVRWDYETAECFACLSHPSTLAWLSDVDLSEEGGPLDDPGEVLFGPVACHLCERRHRPGAEFEPAQA